MLTIPDFTAQDAVFGAKISDYPRKEEIPPEFWNRHNNRFCEIAGELFFGGGALSKFGLQFKPNIDRAKAMTALRAWLSSFEPSHEHKIAAVGYALSQWCEDCAKQDVPTPKVKVAKRKKGKR